MGAQTMLWASDATWVAMLRGWRIPGPALDVGKGPCIARGPRWWQRRFQDHALGLAKLPWVKARFVQAASALWLSLNVVGHGRNCLRTAWGCKPWRARRRVCQVWA